MPRRKTSLETDSRVSMVHPCTHRACNAPGGNGSNLRVGDLPRSIAFYTQVLGMQLIRQSENETGRYTLAFLGYAGGNPAQAELELTYNWGVSSYDIGTAYGHIALGVPDCAAACDKIRAAGGLITREAGPVKGGSTVIAFVQDPDGYKIELIERPASA